MGTELTESEGRNAVAMRDRGLPASPGLDNKGIEITFSKFLAAEEPAGIGMLVDLECLADMTG